MRTTRFGDHHQMSAGRMDIPGGELAYPTPSHGRDMGSDIPTPVPTLGQIDTSENITLTQPPLRVVKINLGRKFLSLTSVLKDFVATINEHFLRSNGLNSFSRYKRDQCNLQLCVL